MPEIYVFVCVSVCECVCVRDRESERSRVFTVFFYYYRLHNLSIYKRNKDYWRIMSIYIRTSNLGFVFFLVHSNYTMKRFKENGKAYQ